MKNRVGAFWASGFFFGYAPIASGTFGTLIAFIIHIFVSHFVKTNFLLPCFLILFIFFFILSILLADWSISYWKHKDPKKFVLDEICAYLLIPIFFYDEISIKFALYAFFIFRFFDIFKPPIARGLDKKEGGIYIVLDDIVSAFYSIFTIYLLKHFNIL